MEVLQPNLAWTIWTSPWTLWVNILFWDDFHMAQGGWRNPFTAPFAAPFSQTFEHFFKWILFNEPSGASSHNGPSIGFMFFGPRNGPHSAFEVFKA